MPDAAPERERAMTAFLDRAGWKATPRLLAGDASFRKYYRVDFNGKRAVLMDAPPPMENVRPFLTIGRHLLKLGLSAPRILAEDAEQGLLLLEDLGDDTYARKLAAGADETALYALAVDLLIELHRRFDVAAAADVPRFDTARALREVNLLLDWYWPAIMGAPATPDLRQSYEAAWRAALPALWSAPDSIALFDFHIDNLMLLEGRKGVAACGLLDFQDAVIAPVAFDLVSLLEDVRRDVPADLVRAMRERYVAAFPTLDRDAFDRSYSAIGAQRNTRIVGVFTRLLVRDGKPRYLQFMPRVWRLLEGDLEHPALARVRRWFDTYVPPAKRIAPKAPA
ncbi:MAG TPA: phosphotransferase [Alphaproteobacteria bacterium]|nr:phosphotransferase [Alphaproteobacteria bacterium]